jgi:hypothetical protein
LRKFGFFVLRTLRKLNKSKKYERKGSDPEKLFHLKRIGMLLKDKCTILYMDEVFFSMKTKPNVVTLYKCSEVKEWPKEVLDSTIGVIALVSDSKVIALQLFRRSLDHADVSIFTRMAFQEVRRIFGDHQVCVITDNYPAHILDQMYQGISEQRLKIRMMKGAKYFWQGNFIEDTFGALKNAYYKGRGNQDIFGPKGYENLVQILRTYFETDFNRIYRNWVKKFMGKALLLRKIDAVGKIFNGVGDSDVVDGRHIL